jgi:hypothetical protein
MPTIAELAALRTAAIQEIAEPTMAFDARPGGRHALTWLTPEVPPFLAELARRARAEILQPSGRFPYNAAARRRVAALLGMDQAMPMNNLSPRGRNYDADPNIDPDNGNGGGQNDDIQNFLDGIRDAISKMDGTERAQFLAGLAMLTEEQDASNASIPSMSGMGGAGAGDSRWRSRVAQDRQFQARGRKTEDFLKRHPWMQQVEVWG